MKPFLNLFIVLCCVLLLVFIPTGGSVAHTHHPFDDEVISSPVISESSLFTPSELNETEIIRTNVTIPFTTLEAVFTVNESVRAWELSNLTTPNQDVYFEASLDVPKAQQLTFSVFDAQARPLPNKVTMFQQSQQDTSVVYGRFDLTRSSKWFLRVNYTGSTFAVVNQTRLGLELYIPERGYDFLKPHNLTENITTVDYTPQFPFETVYWQLALQTNQRVNFQISEVGDEILRDTEVQFYELNFFGNPDRMNIIPEEGSSELSTQSYSWVASGTPEESNVLWIEISFDTLGMDGNLSMIFDYQKVGYSFSTAHSLSINETHEIFHNYTDRYRTLQYFQFEIDYAGVDLHIIANGSVLDNSVIRLYDRQRNVVETIDERYSIIDETISAVVYLPTAGTYYLQFEPSQFLTKGGAFKLNLSYEIPPKFSWRVDYILTNMLLLVVLPGVAAYVLLRNRELLEISQWEVQASQKTLFRTLSSNQRLNPKKEVPFEKILIEHPGPLIRDLIIDLVPVDDESTSLGVSQSWTVPNKMFLIPIVTLMAYWVSDIALFIITHQSLLWWRITEFGTLNLVHFWLWAPLSLLFGAIYVLRKQSFKRVLRELEFTINDLQNQTPARNLETVPVDIEVTQKSLAYVRVLWNQANKAFKENNFSLFIIRADNAVKKLLETRFLQLKGQVGERLEFAEIIEFVRSQGFDIPSTKKIEYFRKIRNKVVHSSHLLDEKTAIETYSYYSKFLGRLGLRT